jgi:hypothetical protein
MPLWISAVVSVVIVLIVVTVIILKKRRVREQFLPHEFATRAKV